MAEETPRPGAGLPEGAALRPRHGRGHLRAGRAHVLAADLRERPAAAESGALLEVINVGAPGFPRWIFEWIGVFAVINSALINMLMASRLLYGMANERILPRDLRHRAPVPPHAVGVDPGHQRHRGRAASPPRARTASSKLGGTTALLLLCVFTVVNIAVLVLRRENVEHRHFRAPTWAPIVAGDPVPAGSRSRCCPAGRRATTTSRWSSSASASCCGSSTGCTCAARESRSRSSTRRR